MTGGSIEDLLESVVRSSHYSSRVRGTEEKVKDCSKFGFSGSKDSGTPSCPSEKWDFPKKADITLAYGTDSATTHFRYGVCPSERQECHALLPTDRGTNEARLYRAQVGSQLLAGPTPMPGATPSGLEGAGGSAGSAATGPHPTPLREKERAIRWFRGSGQVPAGQSPKARPTTRFSGTRPQ